MTGQGNLTDSFDRRIQYLRISVTDRCNLRCEYCMPPDGIALLRREDILSIEEIGRVARCAVEAGMNRLRLSGGEPLVRHGIVELVRLLADTPGLRDLGMTTNGILLSEYAQALKNAGLRRVNVSVDSLDAETYKRITRGGDLSAALAGVQAALNAGLSPVKINVVVLETTLGEAKEFADLTKGRPLHVRFIELMPSSWNVKAGSTAHEGAVLAEGVCGNDAIRRELGDLEPVDGPGGVGPARHYRLPGAVGSIGFISPMTSPFCGGCNRIRLTAAGKLIPCLFSTAEVDLRSPLRAGASDEAIKELLIVAATRKPAGRADQSALAQPSMARVGG